MVKFSHLADCHLGSWSGSELQQLNLESFRTALEISVKEKVDFVLISGDLFDSAYPPIEILKETFMEFRKLKQAKVPCYIIAGSHDFSVSGKTFLDVLENAGFCKNVVNFEEKDNKIILSPTLERNVAIYGYHGKKSSLEIPDLRKIRLNESPGFFKILMLHTTISSATGTLPIDSIDETLLPEADYYALGHLHINFKKDKFVYSGPTFPNNFQELGSLKEGSFYIIDTSEVHSFRRIPIRLKEVLEFKVEITDALTGTQKIISEIDKIDIKDKIILLRVFGNLEKGKHSDINFTEIEKFVRTKEPYTILRNTSKLLKQEQELELPSENMDDIEGEIIKKYNEDNENKFNPLIHNLINSFSLDKQEDEKNLIYQERLIYEIKKVLKLDDN